MYDGTLRVVTVEDVKDPRVVAAGAVVGQLYDFSNLPHVKDHALEDEVIAKNHEKQIVADHEEAAVIAPRYTSEAERVDLGLTKA